MTTNYTRPIGFVQFCCIRKIYSCLLTPNCTHISTYTNYIWIKCEVYFLIFPPFPDNIEYVVNQARPVYIELGDPKILEPTIWTTDVFMQKVKQLKWVLTGVVFFALQWDHLIGVQNTPEHNCFQSMKVSLSVIVIEQQGDWTLRKFLKIVNHFPRHSLDLIASTTAVKSFVTHWSITADQTW